MKKAFSALSSIILKELMINSNDFRFSCVWRLEKFFVLFLCRQHNWVERYRTGENGRNFFVRVYNVVNTLTPSF